ncbi:hypothetical protein ACWFRJ_38110 [Streptomyces sp. NPDC055239]
MGVFARFRRKSKDTEEASTTEAAADTLTAEPEAAGESPEPETGKEEAKAEAAAEDETKADTKADAETEGKTEDEAENTEEAEEAAAENVDIPKQQSAEKAADNEEADEGARK